MTNPIPPTVGRVVLVRSNDWDGDAPGIINRVHSNEAINAFVMTDQEVPYTRSSIPYAEDHDADGLSLSFHWMDYQLNLAAEQQTPAVDAEGASAATQASA